MKCREGSNPTLLPSTLGASYGLTVYGAASSPHSLAVGLAWFLPGATLAAVYLFVAYRSFAGKVSAADQEGY
jgi:cytochrome bd-type quinol oxidase subunit 2